MTTSLALTTLAILAVLAAGEFLCGVLFKDQPNTNNPADKTRKAVKREHLRA